MPSGYLHAWLMECQDQQGRLVNIGVGISEDGRIVLFGPSTGAVSLGPDEANEYILMLTKALSTLRQST